MNKEIDFPNREIVILADDLAKVFIQRRDLYAVQLADGRYACVRKPLKAWHIWKHLDGQMTLGAYLLNTESRTSFVVFDADDEAGYQGLVLAQHKLANDGATSYLESSRRGGHLWMFFEKLVSGREARAFGKGVLAAVEQPEVELFPKQDTIKEGPGSLVRLPFGIHRKTGQRYGFLDLEGQPLANSLVQQIQMLCEPTVIPTNVFNAYRHQRVIASKETEIEPSTKPEEPLSKRIKDSISAYDFLSNYVELSKNGVGRCPFHPDDVASFAVNSEGNYWHCFAGCGGGSIIDFWMKWRKCEFKQALKELAEMLLKP